jgi:hypothetical protein
MFLRNISGHPLHNCTIWTSGYPYCFLLSSRRLGLLATRRGPPHSWRVICLVQYLRQGGQHCDTSQSAESAHPPPASSNLLQGQWRQNNGWKTSRGPIRNLSRFYPSVSQRRITKVTHWQNDRLTDWQQDITHRLTQGAWFKETIIHVYGTMGAGWLLLLRRHTMHLLYPAKHTLGSNTSKEHPSLWCGNMYRRFDAGVEQTQVSDKKFWRKYWISSK